MGGGPKLGGKTSSPAEWLPVLRPILARPVGENKDLRSSAADVILAAEKRLMCFSATANFVGSAALGAVGAVTLTRVKHRRELLFAALPILFAIHQFIEGFVWLGLDGNLSNVVA